MLSNTPLRLWRRDAKTHLWVSAVLTPACVPYGWSASQTRGVARGARWSTRGMRSGDGRGAGDPTRGREALTRALARRQQHGPRVLPGCARALVDLATRFGLGNGLSGEVLGDLGRGVVPGEDRHPPDNGDVGQRPLNLGEGNDREKDGDA